MDLNLIPTGFNKARLILWRAFNQRKYRMREELQKTPLFEQKVIDCVEVYTELTNFNQLLGIDIGVCCPIKHIWPQMC